ncbi:hypothetical protein YC2023_065868 [Brassica napus]
MSHEIRQHFSPFIDFVHLANFTIIKDWFINILISYWLSVFPLILQSTKASIIIICVVPNFTIIKDWFINILISYWLSVLPLILQSTKASIIDWFINILISYWLSVLPLILQSTKASIIVTIVKIARKISTASLTNSSRDLVSRSYDPNFKDWFINILISYWLSVLPLILQSTKASIIVTIVKIARKISTASLNLIYISSF